MSNKNYKQLQGHQAVRPGSTRPLPSQALSLLHYAAQQRESSLGNNQRQTFGGHNYSLATSGVQNSNLSNGGKENSSLTLNRMPAGGIIRTAIEDFGQKASAFGSFKESRLSHDQAFSNGGASRGAIKTYQAEKPRSALGQVVHARTKITAHLSGTQGSDQPLQDIAPVGAQNEFNQAAFLNGQESPPDLSLTATPERTTEKKSTKRSHITETGSEDQRRKSAQRVIQIDCIGCSQQNQVLLRYDQRKSFGNCTACGNFLQIKRSSSNDLDTHQSQAVRDRSKSFHAQVPMDAILRGLSSLQGNGRVHDPRAFYVVYRRYWVDWMYTQSEKLNFQPETFQHCVAVFDAYLQLPHISDHLRSIGLLSQQYPRSEQETHSVLMLIAVVAMFISAKYLEKTYPGFQQLVHITGLPYTYGDFIRMETDVLNALDWEVQYVSVYDILTHFLCQGIVFTTDVLLDASRQMAVSRASQLNLKLKAAHHAERFAEFCSQMCLQYHEFLQYDQVTLTSAIIMAARTKIKVQEVWPIELIAMSGGMTATPFLKQIMKKVLSYYDGIIPQSNSPEQPQTIQKTVKRSSNVDGTATVSIKKRGRGEQTSQDQTTTKKVNSSIGTVGQENETPNKSLLPKNQLVAMAKGGNNATKKSLKVKLSRGMSGVSGSSNSKPTAAGTSVGQNSSNKDINVLSSSKKAEDSRLLKSTESRQDSQPAKKTHILHKQDSSKYLRGNGDEKRPSLQSLQNRATASTHRSTQDGRIVSKTAGKNLQLRVGSDRINTAQQISSREGAQTSKAALINKAVNSSALADMIAAQSGIRSSSQGGAEQQIPTQLGSYLYHQPSQFSKGSAASKILSRERDGSVNFATANMLANQNAARSSSGGKALKISMGASSGLKKVMPHPMLRPKQASGSELPVFLNASQNNSNSQKKVILSKVRNSQLEKSSCNVSTSQHNITQTSNQASAPTNAPQTGTQNKQSKSKSSQSLGPNGLQRNSLQKQFESMEQHGKEQVKDNTSEISNQFVVHTLTTANQRDQSCSSNNSVASYAAKLLKSNTLFANMQVIQQQRKQGATGQSQLNVQAPQVIRTESSANKQSMSNQQLGSLKPSSIQSLMNNLKLQQQSSTGSATIGGGSTSANTQLHHHSNSGSLSNSQSIGQRNIKGVNVSKFPNNSIFGGQGQSRSGLAFAVQNAASNTARSTSNGANPTVFRNNLAPAVQNLDQGNGYKAPINFHPKPQQIRMKNSQALSAENESQAVGSGHARAVSSSSLYR